MTLQNMEDEHKHRYAHYLFRMRNMENEDKHGFTLLLQGDKHGR